MNHLTLVCGNERVGANEVDFRRRSKNIGDDATTMFVCVYLREKPFCHMLVNDDSVACINSALVYPFPKAALEIGFRQLQRPSSGIFVQVAFSNRLVFRVLPFRMPQAREMARESS